MWPLRKYCDAVVICRVPMRSKLNHKKGSICRNQIVLPFIPVPFSASAFDLVFVSTCILHSPLIPWSHRKLTVEFGTIEI